MEEEMIRYLLENGFAVYLYDDDDGQAVYEFTEKGKEMLPAIWEDSIKEFTEGIFRLWMQDAIEVYFDEEGLPLVEITDSSYALAKSKSLADGVDHNLLIELIRMWELKDLGGE